MKLRPIEEYYSRQPEPTKSCLLAMRKLILDKYPQLEEAWKYRMPMFCFQGRMFCYLWTDKKTNQPYLGVVEGRHIEHPALIQGKRSRMKILMIEPDQDLPVKVICTILNEALALY